MRKKTKQYIDEIVGDVITILLSELDSVGKALSTRITRIETRSYRTTGSPLD